jgi:hypothetical protein
MTVYKLTLSGKIKNRTQRASVYYSWPEGIKWDEAKKLEESFAKAFTELAVSYDIRND